MLVIRVPKTNKPGKMRQIPRKFKIRRMYREAIAVIARIKSCLQGDEKRKNLLTNTGNKGILNE